MHNGNTKWRPPTPTAAKTGAAIGGSAFLAVDGATASGSMTYEVLRMSAQTGIWMVGHPTAALSIGAAVAGGVGYRKVARRLRPVRQRRRTTDDGFASAAQLRKSVGLPHIRRQRASLRPSLAQVPRRKVRPEQLAFELGSVVGRRGSAYLPIGDPLLIIAPSGAGKTAKLAGHILDAQGPVIATSTGYDIVALTAAGRRQKGPVYIWNPENLAGKDSTVAWDPVIGCRDPKVAMQRAGYLLSGSEATAGTENRAFWQGSNFDILKSLLYAADVGGLSLLDVAQWAKNPSNTTALEILREAPAVPVGWLEDLEQVQANPKDRTTANIYKTLALTFSCLSNPAVALIIQRAHEPGARFDIAQFITDNGTLYMLGEEREIGGVGPLFTTLTGVLYDHLTQEASRSRDGRLDPPATFALDEAALICSVPLERWTADSRKKQITVHIAMQTPSQLYKRWGTHAGQTIWTNSTLYILGGLSVAQHLDELSKRCGERREQVETSTASGKSRSVSVTTRTVPTLTPQEIASLPQWTALVIRRQLPAFLAVYTPVWERKDFKRLMRAAPVEAAPDVSGPEAPFDTVMPETVQADQPARESVAMAAEAPSAFVSGKSVFDSWGDD
ncbi:type IV secretory system conjugative DNA transfer family protein [Streptomyces sp. G-5]|uniref:type IV secretory system conjugative DNA transfer family protein n=1 Tax=Streptomyces sp. G-5 TaxID=2977231 RepID=UPI0021D19AA7|nr:TraM recognition domain-containing protein [Streptomyces sp. G-5]MCU4750286.1 TraM recognition domain-containing protein [Streptomyces sp. G-5]